MINLKIIVVFLLLAFPGSVWLQTRVTPADIIFSNGNIYTVNERQPNAKALAIKGERIIFVGSNRDIKAYRGPKTKVIDLQGKTVVPGLTDAHYHLSGVGAREMTLNLEGITSLEEFLAAVKRKVDQTEAGKWVTGRGWIETFWQPPIFPTRAELDRFSPNNPVFLVRADGHGGVANSAALKIAEIDKNTPDPFGGEIVRDKATREPLGMLLDNAMDLVRAKIPPKTDAIREEEILLGVKRSLSLGWTQIQNAGSSFREVALYQKLYTTGKIKLRIYNAVSGPSESSQKLIKDGATVGAFQNRLTVRTIKVVFDGSLGSRSAALIEPYADDTTTSGFLTEKPEELLLMFKEALRNGIQIETHAIGDKANRTILGLYEQAFNAVPMSQRKVKEPRWRIEHAQILNLEDIPRLAKLGIIASMQPSHAIGDLFFAPSRLGIKRLDGAYAWNSLIKNGVIIAAGSDAPVERGEPMIEFYAAVARKSLKGESSDGWHPEEAVSREQALKMFTLWAAFAAFEEKEKGSIEVGKLADLTILSQDIMKIPEPEILKTECLMTVIGGEIVFDKNAPY